MLWRLTSSAMSETLLELTGELLTLLASDLVRNELRTRGGQGYFLELDVEYLAEAKAYYP